LKRKTFNIVENCHCITSWWWTGCSKICCNMFSRCGQCYKKIKLWIAFRDTYT